MRKSLPAVPVSGATGRPFLTAAGGAGKAGSNCGQSSLVTSNREERTSQFWEKKLPTVQ